MDPGNSYHCGLWYSLPNIRLDGVYYFEVAGSFREGERDMFIGNSKDFDWEVLSDDFGL